jgi:hypothetical protein
MEKDMRNMIPVEIQQYIIVIVEVGERHPVPIYSSHDRCHGGQVKVNFGSAFHCRYSYPTTALLAGHECHISILLITSVSCRLM